MADSPMWVEGTPGEDRYNADEYRHWQQAVMGGTEGVYPTASGLRVTQRAAGANMSVDVAVGTAFVQGTEITDQGMYAQHIGTAVNRTISAANASNPRIDVVGVQIKDKAISGSEDSGDVVVVTGTASGSPSVPTFPDNFLPLAQIAVAAAASSIVNADITSLRQGATMRNAWDEAAGILRPWDCAWGVLAIDDASSNNSGIATTPTDIGLEVTWTAMANRQYLISGFIPRIQQFTNAAESTVYITNSGGTAFNTASHWSAANEVWSAHVEEFNDALSGSVTRKLRAATTNGTITVFGTGTFQGNLRVEDVGPSGPPP